MKLTTNDFDPSKRGFWAKSSSDKKSVDVYLYDVIGEDWLGGISAKAFAEAVNSAGRVDTINLYINSPGGSVFDAFAMLETLRRNPARVNVSIDGVAASGGSLVAMAGDTIKMAANSLMMIHNAWTVAAGNAKLLADTIDILTKMDSQLADTYSARSGQKRADVVAMLDAETWMTPDEAIDMGFADSKGEALRVAACAFDLKAFGYRHAPQQCGVTPSVEPAAAPASDTALREEQSKLNLEYLKMRGVIAK